MPAEPPRSCAEHAPVPAGRYEQLRHAALHARATAFPLGLGVLTGKGVTAWRHALAGLAPATPATCIARPAEPPGTARPASCAPAVPAHLAIDVLRIAGLDMRWQADAHSILGNVAYHRRHMKDAETEYMLAAQLREQLQDHQAVGRLLGAIGRIRAMRGQYSAALEDLQSAVTRLPEDLVLQTELAKALSIAGQPQAAAAVFGTVLMGEPDSIEALTWRGQLQADRGYYLAALDDLHTLRRLSPSAALQPEVQSAYALALAQAGDAETAAKEADAALAAAPDHGVIVLRAAQVARITGAQERAAELFRMASEARNPPLPPDRLNEVRRWMTRLREAGV